MQDMRNFSVFICLTKLLFILDKKIKTIGHTKLFSVEETFKFLTYTAKYCDHTGLQKDCNCKLCGK